ncbi:tRNA 5-methoxyuridine(34)/uridine 5-oxyacetic acid(34) synthase CmoB [Helicobacter aurati]|uniref:tRNA 5-methoxyuridine(34)/uridine 5-oxyacetic acid(34) synthase CmoB n=1 Tax=Helicobacter aurati TaxID=137778 RepID=A0A3D8J4W5_9HELI|nr:tRNA 5-methoxyuridine(34)/uridine 5-oxyacetic acid(34) synthase CmoB [Helicobacter aurati]RDU72552.1 tRNA 5-methoxyuridine(34)/uridine 5-oxyacetic acid(34) synthase CmoB [Helicobacter aurati]
MSRQSTIQEETYQNLTRDFTTQEIANLESAYNLTVLQRIANLQSNINMCFSVLDSKLSAYLRGMQSQTTSESLQQMSVIAQASTLKSASNLLNGIHIVFDLIPQDTQFALLRQLVFLLKPWRKGPFYLRDTTKHFLFIDSEWQSHIKMQLVLNAFEKLNYQIAGKEILDVGCNNGYYMFDLALRGAKSIVGIDPVATFFLQFYLIMKLTRLSNVSYRLLGVQDIERLGKKFDCVLCMGVLYHRQEPLHTLKQLKRALKKDGILIIETLIIDSPAPVALLPYPTYAKMTNVFYIFSPTALQNLALKAGFSECELISFSYTENSEQRSTQFIDKQSLGDFLHVQHTIEGYPPACRGIFALCL